MTRHELTPLPPRWRFPTCAPGRRAVRRATLAILSAGILASASASAVAGDRTRVLPERLTVYADVVDVRPVYQDVRRSEPLRQECWIEERRHVVREGTVHRVERHDPYRGSSYRERRGSTGDTLIGGVIGGVVGNQIGRNSSRGGRAGATIAGAIVGSAVANEASARASRHRDERYGNEHHRREHHYRQPARTVYETRPVERCRTVETARSERRLQHYDVTYRYEGHRYVTRLPRDPGPTLELEVTVRPARH